jgi:flagellar hook-length control protein FliK
MAKVSDEAHENASSETHFSSTLSGLQTVSPLVSGKMDWLASPVSLRQPQWTQDMGQKIGQMANAKMDEISVRIDPEDLGPVQIKLHMTEDKTAHISMTAQHGLTRDMLENALPRLRELLAQQGIDLGSATVDTGAKEQGEQGQSSQQGSHSASDSLDAAVNPTTEASTRRELEGVIDHYA